MQNRTAMTLRLGCPAPDPPPFNAQPPPLPSPSGARTARSTQHAAHIPWITPQPLSRVTMATTADVFCLLTAPQWARSTQHAARSTLHASQPQRTGLRLRPFADARDYTSGAGTILPGARSSHVMSGHLMSSHATFKCVGSSLAGHFMPSVIRLILGCDCEVKATPGAP